jgi:hypothetical protein
MTEAEIPPILQKASFKKIFGQEGSEVFIQVWNGNAWNDLDDNVQKQSWYYEICEKHNGVSTLMDSGTYVREASLSFTLSEVADHLYSFYGSLKADRSAQREDRPEMLSEGEFINKARLIVWNLFYNNASPINRGKVSIDDVYVVWFCKTLQNWKACVSTNVKDDLYFEVTYDGNMKQAYVDCYKKVDNVVVPDSV